MLEAGMIDKLYLYDENNKLSVNRHAVMIEDKADITILTDGDALLPEMETCWLEEFVELFKKHEDLGVLAFSSKNTFLKNALKTGRAQTANRADNQFMEDGLCIISNDLKREKGYNVSSLKTCLVNGHYLSIKTDTLMKFYKDSPTGYNDTDGGIQIYAMEKGLKKIRYDKGQVENLSTTKCGFGENSENIEIDKSYIKERSSKFGKNLFVGTQLISGYTTMTIDSIKVFDKNNNEIIESK